MRNHWRDLLHISWIVFPGLIVRQKGRAVQSVTARKICLFAYKVALVARGNQTSYHFGHRTCYRVPFESLVSRLAVTSLRRVFSPPKCLPGQAPSLPDP